METLDKRLHRSCCSEAGYRLWNRASHPDRLVGVVEKVHQGGNRLLAEGGQSLAGIVFQPTVLKE